MLGASRTSLAALREQLTADEATAEEEALSGELLAVADLLGREPSLRGALTDPGASPEGRAAIAAGLLGSRIGAPALSVVEGAVRARWARPRDLSDALEVLGAQAAFRRAERDGRLDAVEDELFRFGRTVGAQPELRSVLDNPAVPVEQRLGVLRELLRERVQPSTLALLEHVVRSPRGRRLEDSVEELVSLAAERREEIVADVRVAAPMTADQERRLAAALGGVYGRSVRLQVSVDPTLLGGVVVSVGDEVIDGSVVHRLEQARRALIG
jgi:F-type H+-transporting ATPase subunit delta